MDQPFDYSRVRRSTDCCGCASFPYSLCGPCHRLNFPEQWGGHMGNDYPQKPTPRPGETKEDMWKRINPPITAEEYKSIKPDVFMTMSIPLATYQVIEETAEHYIVVDPEKKDESLAIKKKHCHVVSIAALR